LKKNSLISIKGIDSWMQGSFDGNLTPKVVQ